MRRGLRIRLAIDGCLSDVSSSPISVSVVSMCKTHRPHCSVLGGSRDNLIVSCISSFAFFPIKLNYTNIRLIKAYDTVEMIQFHPLTVQYQTNRIYFSYLSNVYQRFMCTFDSKVHFSNVR